MNTNTEDQQSSIPLDESAPHVGNRRRVGDAAEARDLYKKLHAPGSVLFISLALVAVFVLWAALAPEQLNQWMSSASAWSAEYIGWSYLLVTGSCILLLLFLAFSRYGGIRLGKDGDRPEFSNWAWIAMILGTVMGIGLISYGAAEPMSHFMSPPHGRAEAGTIDAAVVALQFSYFDWGPNAWALFGVFGLAIAYSTHRRGNSGLVSAMLRPVLGRTMDGWLGKAIDIFTVLATLFGTTTSLGLGASQIAEGMNRVLGLPTDLFVKIVIIAGITVIFTLSALSGIGKGIKWLSQGTMIGAAIIGIFVLFSGPTGFITNIYFRSMGQFLGEFPAVALLTPSNGEDLQWMQWWTYFMMAWWLSWGAFVGIFLARISKGRTVRGFVAAVLGIPTLVFSVWFSIFGGTAIHQEMNLDTGIGEVTLEDTNTTFFALLAELPFEGITSVLTIIMVILFFITGADSNTYVLGTLTSGGNMYPKRPVLTVWGLLTGACAIVLMLVGGLQALQQAAILSAVPFTVIVALLGYALVKELKSDSRLHVTE
ncbi:BCCT family transporter [Paeniglutamicibacter psychrophenolicus]|uniref:Choline/carnitine/betaine transport n=1 Tax=Paeniglutamicibacter psychrophenolicus TaxID=257454 RepID=A0ABS4WAM0_9MICC|nr:BCCT family transporter [Paeniglutamicibacter psychrophenolicus]MBP2373252.1 choline/carnitine/betaine transport [Paeniglutamicibacter psychrophenolicus]